jgi:hypothetical protein
MSKLLLPGERSRKFGGVELVGIKTGVYLPMSVGFVLGFLTCLVLLGLR